ncbi:hypothetical protein BDN72DRAFT_847839 [Pluteus cervinus]|uniref:Uncharacterized protein n=1 Tax=Pluteus cervinus TaxID=181527 RepID=A0ACD3AC80_9AGAR|nr:hypothetical protein BDN72DRAFT_847839 [Pluteus cervinus]
MDFVLIRVVFGRSRTFTPTQPLSKRSQRPEATSEHLKTVSSLEWTRRVEIEDIVNGIDVPSA